MRELRIHGRGGQGAVIAAKILAVAAFRGGQWVQAFPAFGVERRGAPVTAFLRLSNAPIQLRCEVAAPDDLLVLDATLLSAIDVTAGLRPGGRILINSSAPAETYASLRGFEVRTIDANAIAQKYSLGTRTQPIVNTAMVGALAAFTGLVSVEEACAAIAEEVPVQAEANIAAAREAAAHASSVQEAVHA